MKNNYVKKSLSFILSVLMIFSVALCAPTALGADKTKEPAKPVDISKCMIMLDSDVVAYTGLPRRPGVSIFTDDFDDLVKGKHYTLSYSDNTECGTGKVTIKGIEKNGYKGTVVEKFKIRPAVVKKTKVSKVTNKTATVSFLPVVGAQGYCVYSYNNETDSYKKLATTKSNIASLKNLEEGTKYKLLVRGYRKVGKKTYYSEASLFEDYTEFTTKGVARPKKLNGIIKGKKTTLSWQAVEGASGYVLFGYSAKTKKYTRLADVKEPTATVETKLTRFAVRAYKTVKGKTESSSKTAIIALEKLTPAQIVKKYNTAVNNAKKLKDCNLRIVESGTISSYKLNGEDMSDMFTSLSGDEALTISMDYKFKNGVSTDEEKLKLNFVLPPANRKARLDLKGVKTIGSAKLKNGETKLYVTLIEEKVKSKGKDFKIPPYHGDVITPSVDDLGIGSIKIKSIEETYKGASVIATIDKKGKLKSLELENPEDVKMKVKALGETMTTEYSAVEYTKYYFK